MSVITILSCFNNDRAKEKLGELLMPSDESRNSALPEYLAEDFQIAWDELREEYRENGYGSNFLDFLKQIYLLLGSSQYLLVNSALGEDQRYQELEALAYYFGVPLADEGINIDLVSTSEVRLNVVVAAEHGQKSLTVLRRAFGL